MKKQQLQSLQLTKNTISKMRIDTVKGGAVTWASNCISECLGYECQVHK